MSQADKVKVSAEEQTPARALVSIHNFSDNSQLILIFPPLSCDFLHCIHIIDTACWMLAQSGVHDVCCTPSSWLSAVTSFSFGLAKGSARTHCLSIVASAKSSRKGEFMSFTTLQGKMSKLDKENVTFVFHLKLLRIGAGALKCCPIGPLIISVTNPVLRRAINAGGTAGRNAEKSLLSA